MKFSNQKIIRDRIPRTRLIPATLILPAPRRPMDRGPFAPDGAAGRPVGRRGECLDTVEAVPGGTGIRAAIVPVRRMWG